MDGNDSDDEEVSSDEADHDVAGVDVSCAASLMGRVRKRNSRGGWNKRWIMVDAELGVMFLFRNQLDFTRRSPAHMYLLSGMNTPQPVNTLQCPHGIEVELMTETTADVPLRPLYYLFESPSLRNTWLSGMQQHVALARARKRNVERPYPRAVIFSRPEMNDFGVDLSNMEGRAIGVVISSFHAGSCLVDAGVQVGDAVLSIDGVCCLSHTHARHLFKTAINDRVELILWS